MIHKIFAVGIITSLLSAGALAQAQNEDVRVDEMVVTATGFEQKLTDAPASISIISEEELQSRPYITLLDAVRYVEGVDIGVSRDKTGQGSISMRGLESDYTLVLVNGRRQNNHGDIYPNNFGGNQFGHVPPLESVERIEVIRGPASTLYGADALGGVINIITKPQTEQWSGSITFGRSLQSDDQFGDDITTDFSVAGPLWGDALAIQLRGSLYERTASSPEFEPAEDPNGELHYRSLGFGSGGKTVDNTNKEIGFSLSWNPSDSQRFIFDYDTSNQVYDNTPVYDLDTQEILYPLGTRDNIESIWRTSGGIVSPRAGYASDQTFDREWWSIAHQGEWGFGNTSLSLSYVDTANEGRTMPFSVAERNLLQEMYDGNGDYAGMTEEERKALAEETFLPRPARPLISRQYTLDARTDIPLEDMAGDHILVLGGQLIDGELEDGVFGIESEQAGEVQKHQMYSLFAEDSWTLAQDMTLTTGLRYDSHDVFGSQVSPRLYGVYNLTGEWTLKGGVSTGYKTPKTTDLYDGITGFGGQGTSPFAGNPELKPETSVNTEIAAYWNGSEGHNFNITLFKTDFEDKITSGDSVQTCEATGGERPCVNLGSYESLGYDNYSQKINIDEVEVQGVEIAGRYLISQILSVRGNYTWTDSEQKSGSEAGQPLTNTAEHMVNTTLEWQATDLLTLTLQAELRSDRYRGWDSVTDQPLYYKNYEVFNLGASYRISDNINLNARINNLLNTDFTSYTATYTDLNNDGVYEYLTGRGVTSEVAFSDDYNVKDKARSFWVGVNLTF